MVKTRTRQVAQGGRKSAGPVAALTVSQKSINIRKTKVQKDVKAAAPHAKNVLKVEGAQLVTTTTDVSLKKLYVANAVQQLFKPTKDAKNEGKKELFEDNKIVYLQVNTIKIPKCPKKVLNLKVTHSILPEDNDIVLITPDLKKQKKTDYEKNVEHYRAVLDKHGIKGIKEIIPWHQLKAQYTEYEMQNRFMGLYDMIICDSSVHSYIKNTFGHMIEKKNKLFYGIKMDVSNLKGAFDKILSQTQMEIHSAGDSYTMQIGHTGMKKAELVDNIMAAANELNEKLPGGFMNIRGLFIKTGLGKSFQFYLSSIHPSELKVPIVKITKMDTNAAIKGELSTLLNGQVTVLPSGDVIMKGSLDEDDIEPAPSPKKAKKTKAGKSNGKQGAVKKTPGKVVKKTTKKKIIKRK